MTGVKSRQYTNTKMIGKKINQLATELAPVSTDLTIIGDPVSGVSKKITLAQLGAIFSGAVSFYTNLASFPVVGDINVIYCAKDTKKLYLWSGSAYVEVFPSQALLDTYQLRSEKGVSNGYASLDSGGKVPISQLPSSIMEYKGTWNAATNTPTLANGTGDTGDVYICNVAGTVNFGAGPLTFAVGDYVIYSGSIWQRSSGAVGTVTSVAATITGNSIGITGSPVTTSGTLALAFAGTSAQYVNGAGNLITFPSIISQAQNLVTEVYNKTGATLTKGTVVYIDGGQGNLPSVTKALATGDATSAQTYGIVQADITNMNNGYVVAAGRLSDLDTQAFTEGTQLYLSATTAGTYTSTKQYAPNHLVYVAIVVRAHPTQGVIEVKIQNGYELDELHNVSAQSPTNNDGIFYNSATSLWEKKSIATVLGYTPQAQLNGTGFVKASGTTITYDNSTYVTTDTFQTISASKTFAVGFNIASAGGTNQISVFANTNSLFSGSGGSNVFGFNSANNIYFGKGLDNGGVLSWNNSAVRYYTLPDATGTIALVGGSGVGTVTSVAALSLGTTGTDLNSTVTNSTTTPVITLNVPTASATNRGALSSTDWSTFNNKQSALTNPVTGTGTTNYLPKFTGTSTIGDSLVSESGSNINISGDLYVIKNESGAYRNLVIENSNAGGYARTVYQVGSGGASGIAGVNYAPSIFFKIGMQVNDTSTPIIFVTNNDSEKVRINASGNLSIGNTNDSFKLDVSGTGRFNSNVTVGNGTTSVSLAINRGAGGDANGLRFQTSGTNNWYIGSAATSANTNLEIYNHNTATSNLTLNYSTGAATFSSSVTATGGLISNGGSIGYGGGELGFGVTTSGATSAIYTLAVDSPILYFDHRATGNTGSWVWRNGSGAGSERMRLNAAGNLGIGTSAPASVLEVAGTSSTSDFRISRTVSASTYFYISAPGGSPSTATLGVSGTSVMALNASGNVGIGTTSPGSKLSIVGLPTSSSGLTSGDIWNDSGTLKIV